MVQQILSSLAHTMITSAMEQKVLSTVVNQPFNGADGNASGIAALIELARYLKISNLKNNNYLFMAYSGEEGC